NFLKPLKQYTDHSWNLLTICAMNHLEIQKHKALIDQFVYNRLNQQIGILRDPEILNTSHLLIAVDFSSHSSNSTPESSIKAIVVIEQRQLDNNCNLLPRRISECCKLVLIGSDRQISQVDCAKLNLKKLFCVEAIWVESNLQRLGLARHLLETFRTIYSPLKNPKFSHYDDRLVENWKIAKSKIAFSNPTDEGLQFGINYLAREDHKCLVIMNDNSKYRK
ncbi:MAG: hypothetical protein MHMPM18_004453, partial [Marteilia pararefringens]